MRGRKVHKESKGLKPTRAPQTDRMAIHLMGNRCLRRSKSRTRADAVDTLRRRNVSGASESPKCRSTCSVRSMVRFIEARMWSALLTGLQNSKWVR
jgi:hypothetical protein